MAQGSTGRWTIGSRQQGDSPYPLPSNNVKDNREIIAKTDWEDVTCSVCMEYPHKAVLLLCSSYNKGCRPYMCGTSFRYSNCLEQYQKHIKVAVPHDSLPHRDSAEGLAVGPLSCWNMDNNDVARIPCPLCRGKVKGWTLSEPARKYLNTKRRNCMQENCLFVGTYKELKKHVKVDHPSARPHKVDSVLKQKWTVLEHDRERDDVISTLRSSMPGAVVLGDYVIEANNNPSASNAEDGFDANAMERNGRNTNRALNRDEDFQGNGGVSLANRLRRHGRVLLGRSGRRQRHREASRNIRVFDYTN